MQNSFLSSALSRPEGGGIKAEQALLAFAIPAACKAGLQIVWLTRGIADDNLSSVPPTIWRTFGWNIADEGEFDVEDDGAVPNGTLVADGVKHLKRKEKKSDGGLGTSLGEVTLPNGPKVDAGRMLIQNQWNRELHDPLKKSFEEGQKASKPNVRFHKELSTGLGGQRNGFEEFLVREKITTLFLSGVNTD
jgi:nicotinamidase-related amidase